MMFKSFLIPLCAGLMMLAPLSINAATFQTKDNSLTIETPDDTTWKKKDYDNHNLVISSSTGTIIIDQFKNGEMLPNIKLANEDKQGVIQSFLSTPNEVYVVKGKTEKPENLETIIKIIGTIKLTRYEKKTAASPASTSQKSGQSQPSQGSTVNVGSTGNNQDANQGKSIVDTFPVWFEDGTSAGTMVECSNGRFYLNDNESQQFDYRGNGAYYNAQYTVFAYNPAQDSNPVIDSFPVWFEDGTSAGTMVECSNGRFYLNDNESQQFDYRGNGVYYNVQYIVLSYDPTEGSNGSQDAEELLDTIPVWDENGNAAGELYQYTNGRFYLNDSHAEEDVYSYMGSGVYQNIQMTLYAYNPGSADKDEVDYDDDDYDHGYDYNDYDDDYDYDYDYD